VQYRCSRCHHAFEGDGEACPNCKAEAGLEPVHGVPPAMRMFGLLLGTVIVVAIGGGLLTRLTG
jgi:hypothetical protein